MQAPRRQSNFLACVNDCVTETYQPMRWFLEWYQQERGHWGLRYCGVAVLDNFSCGISVIIISKFGMAVSELARCVFLAFWTLLKIILLVLQRFPSLFQFMIGHSQWNLALVVTENCNSVSRNRKRVCYFLLIISQPRQWMLLILSKSKITWPNVH